MFPHKKQPKVPYERIRHLWEESQRLMDGTTKSSLARRLGLSVRTVRAVVNRTYDRRAPANTKTATENQQDGKATKTKGMQFYPF